MTKPLIIENGDIKQASIDLDNIPLRILPATGTVNGSNLEFTFSEEPLMININGALYPKETGVYNWTWSAGTATLAIAVGTGGFIHGVV